MKKSVPMKDGSAVLTRASRWSATACYFSRRLTKKTTGSRELCYAMRAGVLDEVAAKIHHGSGRVPSSLGRSFLGFTKDNCTDLVVFDSYVQLSSQTKEEVHHRYAHLVHGSDVKAKEEGKSNCYLHWSA